MPLGSNSGGKKNSRIRGRPWLSAIVSMLLFVFAVISAEVGLGGIYLSLALVVLGGFAMLIPRIRTEAMIGDSLGLKIQGNSRDQSEEENILSAA